MVIGLIWPNKNRRDKTVHLGLGYLASYARAEHQDIEIVILDTRVATKKESRKFFDTNFDLIGITVLSPVYYEVIDIFNYLRKNKANTPICLGGPYVTTITEEIFLDTPADYAVYGEGEITFVELISHLKNEKQIEEIKGLMYLDASGNVVTNPPRDQVKDLDNLPIPAYDLFHMNRYPMHRIATSRGCPYTCSFCNSSSIWLGKWRKRSVENIVDEIKFLIRRHKKKTFFLNDNSFNVDLKRVEAFCNSLVDNNLNILWSTPVRVELITEPIAQLMRKAGCYNVGIGIESANNGILARMKKMNSIEAVNEGIRIFKKAGIEVLGQFVIGSPGDTIETVKESIEFAKASELDFVMFYSILPFKGTPQWDYVLKNGTLYTDKIHDFHTIQPRIIFETPEFSYGDRLKAIEMAKEAGFYSDSNEQSKLFDLGKDIAKNIQEYLPNFIANRAYMIMKNIYRKRLYKNI